MWIVVVDRRAVPREPGPASSRFYAISQTVNKRATPTVRFTRVAGGSPRGKAQSLGRSSGQTGLCATHLRPVCGSSPH